MKLQELEFKLRQSDLNTDLTLSKGVYIPNVNLTVESLLNVLKNQSGKKGYLPYYNLLMNIYTKLNENKLR